MKKIIFGLLVCFSCCISFGQANKSKVRQTAKPKTVISSLATYDNKEHKIKFQYPKTWELTDTVSDAVVYIFAPEEDEDQFRENLSISAEDISQMDITFKSYVDQNIASIKDGATILDFKQISAKYIKLNGKEAYEIIYTGRMKDVEFGLSICQRFIFHRGKAYIITYSAQGERKDPFVTTAKQIMNSMKFY